MTVEELTTILPRRYGEKVIDFNGEERQIRFQSLTELEKTSYENFLNMGTAQEVKAKKREGKTRLIALALVDADGNRILDETQSAALLKQDGRLTSEIFDAIWEHCFPKRKSVEELAKNSEAALAT